MVQTIPSFVISHFMLHIIGIMDGIMLLIIGIIGICIAPSLFIGLFIVLFLLVEFYQLLLLR